MFRLYDFECEICGDKKEHLVDVPNGEKPPKETKIYCDCRPNHPLGIFHKRVVSKPARYMGECYCAPQVNGGEFDTMGMKELLPTPDLPGQDKYQELVAKRMEGVRENASPDEVRQAFRDATKDAPSSSDYAALFQTSEYKEARRVNEKIKEENKQKRKRAAALKKGENINFKKDKCLGDPKW